MSRVPSPPPPAEMSSGPVAESWCYTQVSSCFHPLNLGSWEDFMGERNKVSFYTGFPAFSGT